MANLGTAVVIDSGKTQDLEAQHGAAAGASRRSRT